MEVEVKRPPLPDTACCCCYAEGDEEPPLSHFLDVEGLRVPVCEYCQYHIENAGEIEAEKEAEREAELSAKATFVMIPAMGFCGIEFILLENKLFLVALIVGIACLFLAYWFREHLRVDINDEEEKEDGRPCCALEEPVTKIWSISGKWYSFKNDDYAAYLVRKGVADITHRL